MLFSGDNARTRPGFGRRTGRRTARWSWHRRRCVGGVHPFDLTVFNGKALFTGADTAGHLGLWMTDGTAAGTQELTGIAGRSRPASTQPT